MIILLLALQDFDKVEITSEKLADGVYMLVGAGGNMGLSMGSDGAVLIDDQFAPLTDKIRAAVAAIGEGELRFVVNTHWHGDHTGGNENLGKAGAVIVAHENVRKRMSVDQVVESLGREFKASPKDALPVVSFSERATLHLNGDDLDILHVENAHTDGDAIVHWRAADVIHMGDTFFNGMYPFIDTFSGGGIDGMIAAADLVLSQSGEKTKIIPGHGPLADRAALQAFRDMLAGVRGAVAAEIRAGKTLEEIVAAKPTATWDDVWGKGFLKPDKFAEIVYDSLSK